MCFTIYCHFPSTPAVNMGINSHLIYLKEKGIKNKNAKFMVSLLGKQKLNSFIFSLAFFFFFEKRAFVLFMYYALMFFMVDRPVNFTQGSYLAAEHEFL